MMKSVLREIENGEQFEIGGLKSAKLFNGNDNYLSDFHNTVVEVDCLKRQKTV